MTDAEKIEALQTELTATQRALTESESQRAQLIRCMQDLWVLWMRARDSQSPIPEMLPEHMRHATAAVDAES